MLQSQSSSARFQAPRARTHTHTHSHRHAGLGRVALGRKGLDGRGVVGEQRAGRQRVVLGGGGAVVVEAIELVLEDDGGLGRESLGRCPLSIFCFHFAADGEALVAAVAPRGDDEYLNVRAP